MTLFPLNALCMQVVFHVIFMFQTISLQKLYSQLILKKEAINDFPLGIWRLLDEKFPSRYGSLKYQNLDQKKANNGIVANPYLNYIE